MFALKNNCTALFDVTCTRLMPSCRGFVSDDDASSSSSYILYIVVAMMGRYGAVGSCFVTTFFDFIFTPQTPKNEKKEFVCCVNNWCIIIITKENRKWWSHGMYLKSVMW